MKLKVILEGAEVHDISLSIGHAMHCLNIFMQPEKNEDLKIMATESIEQLDSIRELLFSKIS